MLAYNEFAYKKTKDTYKLGDRFLKNSIYANSQIKRPHITRSACTSDLKIVPVFDRWMLAQILLYFQFYVTKRGLH